MAINSVMKFPIESPQGRMRMIPFRVTFGAADLQVLTVPAFAGMAQAAFLMFENVAGLKVAAWFDKDADGTLPTADIFNTAPVKVQVPVVTGDTAADVAAALVTALGASLANVTITDNTDGTIDFLQDIYGETPVIGEYTADGAAGPFTVSVTTAGVDPTLTAGKFDATIAQASAGLITITFNEPFARVPEAAVLCITDNMIGRITAITEFLVTVETLNVTSGTTTNANYSMIVCGSDAKDIIS